MNRIITFGRRTARVAPVEYRDAVGLYARDAGLEGGDVVWVDHPANCWQVRLALQPNDPRRRLMDGERHETVELQEFVHPDPSHPAYPRREPALLAKLRRDPRTNLPLPGYVALELSDLGVEGVLDILRRGSLVSGRGEFKSAEEALRHRMRNHRELRAKARAEGRQRARDVAVAARRRILKIPFLPVGVELGRPAAKEEAHP